MSFLKPYPALLCSVTLGSGPWVSGEGGGGDIGIKFAGPAENLKVTVQFETEGNDQNEIFSHMNTSEVKL